MLPDSPRYYASVGRNEEVRDLLSRLRCHKASPAEIDHEYLEIVAVAKDSQPSSPIQFVKNVMAREGDRGPTLADGPGYPCGFNHGFADWYHGYHCIFANPPPSNWIQQPDTKWPCRRSQYDSASSEPSSVRRLWTESVEGMCLVLGALILFIVEIVLTGSVYEAFSTEASKFAPTAVAMLFLFNLAYAATWGTVAFLVPTETFPPELRTQGNGSGITGWAVDVGMTTLNPIMFHSLKSRKYFLLAGLYHL